MTSREAEIALVAGVLAARPPAIRDLVDALAPVVQARVARALLRSATRKRQARDLRQDVEDFTQEVFASLFADGGLALKAWDPQRGLSLANFVGLVADHQVVSILRSGRRSPWTDEPTISEELDRTAGVDDGAHERVYSRQVLAALNERLRAALSPRGYHLFQLLVVEEKDAADVCRETGMTVDAVYAWRSRLGKLARRLLDEIASDHVSDDAPSPRIPTEEGAAQ